MLAGTTLHRVAPASLVLWADRFTHNELLRDPHDHLANFVKHWAQDYSVGQQHFYSWYLVSHGLIKLMMVIGLWRGWLWSYPAAIAGLAGFVVYQLYRYSFTHSPFLLALSIFDLFFMWLIYKEWRSLKGRAQPAKA